MLLALDVGNTQTVAGLYEGRTLREHWRTATVRTHTGDELAVTLVGLLRLRARMRWRRSTPWSSPRASRSCRSSTPR